MRVILFIPGLLVCAYKGAKLPFAALRHAREREMFRHWFGFTDPRIDYVYANIRAAPWRMWKHELTDLIVEWNKLDTQRAAKFAAALIVIPWIIHWIM